MKSIVLASAMLLSGSVAGAQMAAPAPVHRIYQPGQVVWGPAPASLPPGAQAAVLYGDPTREGPFVLRLKLPPNYLIPPHTHPRPELVTVISGEFHVGMGTAVDPTKFHRLPAGSFFGFDPGLAHFAHVDVETVVQISSVGPWGIAYVNAADDPRNQPAQERGG